MIVHISRLLLLLLFTVGLAACITETEDPALPAPNLVSPSNDTTNAPLEIALRWAAVQDAESYVVQVSEREDFTTIVDSVTTGVLVFLPRNLEANRTYYWHVRAQNKKKFSPWSGTRRFATGAFHRVPGVGSSFHFRMENDGKIDSTSLTVIGTGQNIRGRSNVTVFAIGKENDSAHIIYKPNGDLTLDNRLWETLPFGSKSGTAGEWDTTYQTMTYLELRRSSTEYLGSKQAEVMGNTFIVFGASHKIEYRQLNRSTGVTEEYSNHDEFWYAPSLGMFVESTNSESRSSETSKITLVRYELR